MVVDDFDLVALPFVPDEADAPLVVDPDAVLACALRSQSLQAICRRYAQVVEALGAVRFMVPRVSIMSIGVSINDPSGAIHAC